MKHYPTMSREPVFGQECYIFEKLDGSQIRVEWTPKKGFRKFGTRTRLIDESTEIYGEAVSLLKREEEKLTKFLTSLYITYFEKLAKQERKRLVLTIYGEFYGASSQFGTHVLEEPHIVSLFDVEVYRFGFISPSEFLETFHDYLNVPLFFGEYEITKELVSKIRAMEGEWSQLSEGVVCKYVDKTSGSVMMFKIKTQEWLDCLRVYVHGDTELYKRLV
jgi:hypothetical protein